MEFWSALGSTILEHWQYWLVSIVLIVAAVIDGVELRVPNWLTFPLVFSGWIYSTTAYGWDGFSMSLWGTAIGLLCLLPAYAIGGMGAGDVKLMAGVGAWVYSTHTFFAFCASAVVGAVLAVLMVLSARAWKKHQTQFWLILCEILTIRKPTELSEIAAERKSRMMLLPYGIPICIGTIGYFAWTGMLL